jgi:hypothetical protein
MIFLLHTINDHLNEIVLFYSKLDNFENYFPTIEFPLFKRKNGFPQKK